MPAVDYGTAWLQAFLERASGLEFEEAQAASVLALAERKLVDLFDVAEQTAIANGRQRILRHDLPITKGFQMVLGQAEALAADVELRPLLVFLADFEPKGAVAKTYGAYRGQDGVAERALFVIDGTGTIHWSYLSPIGVNPGADGILEALESLTAQSRQTTRSA